MSIFSKAKVFFILFFLQLMAQNAEANVRDNFYLGLGLVDSINHFELKLKNTSTQNSIKRKKEHNELLGNAFLGYGYTAPCSFYIAGEVGTNFPKRSKKISHPGVTLISYTFVDQLSIQEYVTGDVLLGYRPFDCFVVYLRGGVSVANIKLNHFANSVSPVGFDADKTKAGGRVGAGLSYGLTKHFGLSADYTFTRYQNFRAFWPMFSTLFVAENSSHLVNLSAIYSF